MAGGHPAARRGRACPICGKPSDVSQDPFCSKRCREIDLGNWLGGRYAIPTDEAPEPGAPVPTEGDAVGGSSGSPGRRGGEG